MSDWSAATIVAIGGGKGGVGKSTVSLQLALALARRGLRVGLLDADLYGPDIPLMIGSRARNAHVNGSSGVKAGSSSRRSSATGSQSCPSVS